MHSSPHTHTSCFRQTVATINAPHSLPSSSKLDRHWSTNSPPPHLSKPHSAIENVTPSQHSHHSSSSTPDKFISPPFMTPRTSISSVSDMLVFNHRKTRTPTSTITTQSTQQDKVSQCDANSPQSITIQRTRSSPTFAQPTASSRKRTETLKHPVSNTTNTKLWSPSYTKAKSPNLRCVGKPSTFTSTKPNHDLVKTPSAKSLNHSTSCSTISPSKPKTPNVLRRKSMYTRKSHVQEQLPNRAFVPNPIPRYLKKGSLPEVKQTRTSQQRAEAHTNPERTSKTEAPKNSLPSVSLEPTAVKPFALGSVVKHEERIHQIQRRMETEENEDKKRRDFCPVVLRPEILQGPTFVPRKSEIPLTRPVDLLPHAKERSMRTLAFEAGQRARIEEIERSKKAAEEEREKIEEERLRKEYELKRFKPRPVPHSHFTPDIHPVKFENKTTLDNSSSHVCSSQTHSDAADNVDSDETSVFDDTQDLMAYKTESPVRSESKAASILMGIRNSLSPLLGRSSTSSS